MNEKLTTLWDQAVKARETGQPTVDIDGYSGDPETVIAVLDFIHKLFFGVSYVPESEGCNS